MIKTLAKVAVVAGVAAGGVYLWRRYEVTDRLVDLVDQLAEKILVGEDEDDPREISESHLAQALRERPSAAEMMQGSCEFDRLPTDAVLGDLR